MRLLKTESSNSSHSGVWGGSNIHLDLGSDKPRVVLDSNPDLGGTCLHGTLSK